MYQGLIIFHPQQPNQNSFHFPKLKTQRSSSMQSSTQKYYIRVHYKLIIMIKQQNIKVLLSSRQKRKKEKKKVGKSQPKSKHATAASAADP
jgi:hypothetical protein